VHDLEAALTSVQECAVEGGAAAACTGAQMEAAVQLDLVRLQEQEQQLQRQVHDLKVGLATAQAAAAVSDEGRARMQQQQQQSEHAGRVRDAGVQALPDMCTKTSEAGPGLVTAGVYLFVGLARTVCICLSTA
jgi:hypothetical protein